MSSLDTEDYFDIPEVRKTGEFKPVWTSADAHLNPQNQQVTFIATNSRFTKANPRDKIPSKVLKAMEEMDQAESTRAVPDAQGEHSRENRNHEQENLDAWNPMLEDYESKVFNSYKEPSVADFKSSFPGISSETSQPSINSTLKSEQGDVRLFVGRIPPKMTREGLHNLFSQVGKPISCNLIQQHNKDTNIGFVGFETVREAEAAIQKFDGFDLGQGGRLKVALALAKQKPTFGDMNETEPIVNGVPESTDEAATLRQNKASIQDGVSSSDKSNVTLTGKPCSFCGQLGLKWCSVCKIPYCSRDCQKNDWPKHKLVCPRQVPAERKTTNSESCQETSAPLTTTPGEAVQPSSHTQEQTDSPHVPPGDSVQPSVARVGTIAPGETDEETPPGSDNVSEKDPVKVDGFDVNNVEMFAQMMGFDLNQVQFVEKSKDSDNSDDSDRSSSSSLDNIKPQEALPKVTVPSSEGPSQQTLNTERLATQPNSNYVGLQQVRPSATPTCAEGHKRFFIKQFLMESVSEEGSFEAVVTVVENPSCLWAQLCTPEALERQDQIKKNLQSSYCNSVYENYVPSGGEVCVAQFSFDSCWYRVKVDIVNNTGTLRVTYIDFGNHEDITVDKVRRITEDLASFPRQALRLSLHGITSTDPSGKWSSEATAFVKSKVLGIKCKVQVGGQHNEILFVKLFDPKETNTETTINDSLMESGFAKTRVRMPSSPNTPKQLNSATQHESQSSPQHNVESQYYGQKTSFYNSERRQFNQSNSSPGQDNAKNQVKSPPFQSDYNGPRPKECQDSPRNSTGQSTRKAPFEAVINAIVNPWEFYAQKTDPQLLDKLNALMRDLNQHMTTSPGTQQTKASFLPGEVCAAKFSLDNLWYRAVVLKKHPSGFRIRYMDFGNSEIVKEGALCPLHQQFQSFPPLSLQCSLAGVKKPKGQDWSPEAVKQFKSLVANKPFLCRIVYTHGVVNIVELLDPQQNREQTVANALISSGLADAFIHKDGTKHQLDGKRASAFTGAHSQGDGAVLKSPSDDTRKSPFTPQSSLSHNGGPLPRDRIECAVFEPAVQAAALPQDATTDVLVTEVVSPGLIYCQIASVDMLTKNARLIQDMNEHYNAVSYPPVVAHENDFCAAHFSQSGDWCRAFIKGTSPDGSAYVHYVDYGNTEFVPVDCLRPLLEQFNFTALPFAALRCSLANTVPLDLSGWSDEAMSCVKTLLPENSRCSVHLVGRRRGKLFVDITVNETGESVSKALVKQGLVKMMVKGDRHDRQNPHHPTMGPRNQSDKEVRESKHQTPDSPTASQTSMRGDSRMEHQGEHSQPDAPLLPSSRQSASSASSAKPAGDLKSCVLEPAIKSVAVPDSFEAMITHVSSPSAVFVQVLHHDKVQSMTQLSADLNAHYNTVTYPPFQSQGNQMCAGLFSESGDWCRGFIDSVSPDGSVHVHYLDYGNSEVLSSSQVRPLEEHFQQLPPMALQCSLSGILPTHSNGWSTNAQEAILSKAPQDSRVNVQVIRKESGLLFIDATTPESQESLSQFLIKHGLASANSPGEEHSGKQGQENKPGQSAPAVPTSDNRVYASAIPMVDVPLDTLCQVLISEVQRPDKIFFHVLNQENVQGLLTLSEKLTHHCSTVDNNAYKPVQGELCCAQFSQDQEWYRAVVQQEVSQSQMMVVFVDYGNQDDVAVDSIRRIIPSFTQLPIQARECFLTGIQPPSGSSWSTDAVNFLTDRLMTQPIPKPFFVNSDNTKRGGGSLGVQLFEVDPSQQPGISINQEMIQHSLARSEDQTTTLTNTAPDVDQFDVVVTEVVHPGEIWAQVLDAEARNLLNSLMEQINQYCMTASMPTSTPQPGQDCCAQFSQDGTWYRARVLECSPSGQVGVQFVDFGNSELLTPDKIRPMKDEFIQLPAQALKLSLANIRPVHQVWNQEAVTWLNQILNRELKIKVIHRLSEHLVVSLADGPINISEELVRLGYAVKS